MGRAVRVAAAVLIFVVGSAEAGSGLRLDLGIGAEYWWETRGPRSMTAEQQSLRAAIDLVLSGHVADPRFLTFQLGVHGSYYRYDPTGGEVGANRPLGYDARIRAFSNRLVSVEAAAGRQTTDTTGSVTGAVAGTRDFNEAKVWFRPKELPSLILRRYETTFEADDPTTYRDEDQTIYSLGSGWRKGIFAGTLDARMEQRSYSGGRVLNDFNFGHLTLDFNRGGKNAFFTLLQASGSTTTVEGRENPTTTSLISRSVYTRQVAEDGRFLVRLDHQDAGTGGETSVNDQLAVSYYGSLSEEFQIESEASYLVGENSDGIDIRQPALMVGLPWGRSTGRMRYALRPRVTYTGRPLETDEADSRFGGSLFGSIQWNFEDSMLMLEAEVLRNNLSIVPLGPGEGIGGGSLLAGLEKSHEWGRFTVMHSFTSAFRIDGSGEYRIRTRVFQGTEADESEALARLGIQWWSLSLRSGYSSFDVTGGDLPRSRATLETTLSWTPSWWLRCYLTHRTEDLEDPVVGSEYRLDEAGVELQYGKLMFFARWRRDSTVYDVAEPFDNERIWVGFRRWFGGRFGETIR